MFSHPDLPRALDYLRDFIWTATTIGKSGAKVWRLTGEAEALYLKAAPGHGLSEMPGEAARLRWLAARPIPAPRLCAFTEDAGTYWLLMGALPGSDLTHWTGRPADLAELLAGALRQLHELDPASCPFDHHLDRRLAAGAANLNAGRVDETDFDSTRAGWTGRAVLRWLEQNRPRAEDLVVTHGDASLPNVMAASGKLSGMVDCGRLGVADRWQDLAIACRSLIANGAEAEVASFLRAYGAKWDKERYRFYCTLDELF